MSKATFTDAFGASQDVMEQKSSACALQHYARRVNIV